MKDVCVFESRSQCIELTIPKVYSEINENNGIHFQFHFQIFVRSLKIIRLENIVKFAVAHTPFVTLAVVDDGTAIRNQKLS